MSLLLIFYKRQPTSTIPKQQPLQRRNICELKMYKYMNKQNKKKATENVCHTASNLSIKDFLFFYFFLSS